MNSRDKGKRGERELAKKLEDRLGVEMFRNLDQVRNGGQDLIGLDGYAIECKRVEKPNLRKYWYQTVRQAKEVKQVPVLAYRVNRSDWRFVLPLWVMQKHLKGSEWAWDYEHTGEGGIEWFAFWVRENG